VIDGWAGEPLPAVVRWKRLPLFASLRPCRIVEFRRFECPIDNNSSDSSGHGSENSANAKYC